MSNRRKKRCFHLENYKGLEQLPEIQTFLRQSDRKIQKTEQDHKRATFVFNQADQEIKFLSPREESLDQLLEDEHVQIPDLRVDVEKEVMINEIYQELYRAFDRLTKKEQWLVVERYFSAPRSQQQVADELGVTQQTVSRWEKRVLRKLRKWIIQEIPGLKNFFEIF